MSMVLLGVSRNEAGPSAPSNTVQDSPSDATSALQPMYLSVGGESSVSENSNSESSAGADSSSGQISPSEAPGASPQSISGAVERGTVHEDGNVFHEASDGSDVDEFPSSGSNSPSQPSRESQSILVNISEVQNGC